MNSEPQENLFWYRVKLVSLVAVFLFPFVAGWLALYVFELRPESGNYGTLVQPVRKIDWSRLQGVDAARTGDGHEGKWRLILFAGEVCDEPCRANLYYLRQLRILLGRDTPRLRNLMFTERPLNSSMGEFLRDYPELSVIENYRDSDFYSQFDIEGEGRVGESPKLYLVDPDDNLMMHYPAEIDQNRVLEDVRKLMKVSQIG